MTVTVEIDKGKLEGRFKDCTSNAQKAVDAAVLSDSNVYCPKDTGKLIQSSITHTVIGSGRIIWETPYAQKQYYENLSHAQGRNPYATMKWFESAKAKNLNRWVKVAKDGFKR